MKFKIDKDIIKNIFLLLPFFELQSFTMLSDLDIYSTFFNFILQIMSICRIFITAYVFLNFFKRKFKYSNVVICTMAFIIFENITSLFNGSLYFNYFIGSMTYIGFIILCSQMINKSDKKFIKSCLIFFGILSILGALHIILMPYGFTNVSYKSFAVYLLGAKNTSFFYYTVFLFFAFIQDISKKGKISVKTIGLLSLFSMAAIICDSMNSLGMLLILWIFILVFNVFYKLQLYKIIKPQVVIFIIITAAVIILTPNGRKLITPIVAMFGRNANFTGRDVLWSQAVSDFLRHPLIGNGINTKYLLATGVFQDNAHSHFLDILSKYGLITFVLDLSIPLVALKGTVKCYNKNKMLIAAKAIIIAILLLHSIIDHVPLYHYFLVIISAEQLGKKKEKYNG